jgi:hypothetical protein
MTRYRERYQEIYNLLSRAELQRGSEGLEEFSGPDLFRYDTDLWLGFYTHDGIMSALERYGFFADLNRLGFEDFYLETRTDDPDEHMLRLWSTRPALSEPLVELVVRRDFIRPQSPLSERLANKPLPVLTVEWLLLQNPLAEFRQERLPLPGQHYPGLGVGGQVLEILRNTCKRLNLAGIATVPSYFHNAVFYSEEFRHFDPYWQGAFLALCRDVIPKCGGSVAVSSWALYWRMVRDTLKDDPPVPFAWFQELMINAFDPDLKAYFADRHYLKDVQQGLTDHSFVVFEEAIKQTMARKGLLPLDQERLEAWVRKEI